MEERRSKERVLALEIYTDGSLKKSGTQTFGGWSFIAVRDSEEIEIQAGSERNTTNQRMELTAIEKALEYAYAVRRPNEKVTIYSDSAYAVNCFNENWYLSWMQNGWLNSKGKEVANQDLWYKIVPFFDNFWYDFRKVLGHAGNYWNERCDELAQKQADALKQQYRG